MKRKQNRKYFSLFILLFSFNIIAQTNLSTSENFIYTKSCLDADCIKRSEAVQYFDGLGRPVQSIALKATPLGRDVVTPIEYDSKGREAKNYLPVPQSGTQNGAIYTNPLGNASSAGYGNERIYSEKIYDHIYTGRVNQLVPPGNSWSQKPSNMSYGTNTDGEVRKFIITTGWLDGRTDSGISLSGSYTANQLMKTSAADPDGNVTTEFQNGEGQTVLVRKNDGTKEVDTYYLYNEYGQLVYVLPPLAVGDAVPDQTALNNLCYQYRYDGLGRLVEKKLPGKGWEYMVYDKADRLIATQDAELKKKGQWLYTKYDGLGRVAITGICTGSERSQEQDIANGYSANRVNRINTAFFERQGMDVYYDNPDATYPNSSKWVTLLSLNYYDTYPQYSFSPAFPTSILGQSVITDIQNAPVNTQAMPTLSLVKNIEDDNWTKSYVYYDVKGRSVGSHSINHLGGYTRTESELDFAGVVKQTKVYHKRLSTDTEKVLTQNFEYDSQNRLKKQTHQVDSGATEILAENTYNELSQLSQKKVGNGLQTIDYGYDIRGVITKINDPANLGNKLFGYEVKYQNPEYANVAPGKSNGNISEVDWKVSSDGILKRYSYVYDPLNRLKDAIYSEPGTTVPYNNKYNEHVTYDLNGNIKTLKRNGFAIFGNTATMVDDLVYQYTGNRLDKVIENALNDTGYEGGNNTMSYDANGNMTTMPDKGIQSVGYNFMNLPDTFNIIQTFLGETSYVNLNYLYRTDGTKLRKIHTSQRSGRGSTLSTVMTDYLDGFQYDFRDLGGIQPCLTCKTESAYEEQAYTKAGVLQPVNSDWTLDFVATSEGFYSFTENRYIYQYRDHLGNVRVSFTRNSEGAPQITDTNNYYPFGLSHIGQDKGLLGGYLNYKFGGKELQETGMFDFGARFYMPDLGRWGVIDPLAEQMRRYSPYNYAYNNPVTFTDPDGRKPMAPDQEQAQWMFPMSLWSFYANGGGNGAELNEFIAQNNGMGAFQDLLTGTMGKKGGGGMNAKNVDSFVKNGVPYERAVVLSNGGQMSFDEWVNGNNGGGNNMGPNFRFPEGTEAFYQKNYPGFYNFIKNQLPNMVGDGNFMKALSSASGFSVEELTESFKYGKGMFLKVMDLTLGDAEYLYGGITESNTRNMAAIDTPVLAWFEKANRNPQSIEGLTNLMYMSALIGHESAHWGDDIKRTVKYGSTGLGATYGDVGNFFEQRAFGGRMGSYSVGISGSIRNYVKANFKLLQSIFK
ncbi:hypothetical protein BBI00_04835 [Chryseobacterium arthrosphaerae]|uniref:Uncharacterized protein n=1 Tax=Chryseobacterium arthrosphaerae TaxID=651561 RepID=A0A1B8ZQ53_9FLAO|nr:hypothetical protein BBI00_04835 [Chryseobacterium arthrosphaerae]